MTRKVETLARLEDVAIDGKVAIVICTDPTPEGTALTFRFAGETTAQRRIYPAGAELPEGRTLFA